MLIGELNQDEVVPPNRFPNPLPAAWLFLVEEYKKPNQPEAIQLATLLGILRHVQLDWARPEANRIPAAQKQEVLKLMLALVEAKEPPAGTNKAAHSWMQRRAIDVIAALGVIGNHDGVNKALTGYVRDHDAELSVRLAAAASLARLPGPNAKSPQRAQLEPAGEALRLGGLLVEACQHELARIDETLKKGQNPMMDTYGGYGGYGGGDMSSMMMGSTGGMAGAMPGDDGGGGYAGSYGAMPGGYGGEAMGGMGGYGAYGMGGPKDPQLDLYRRKIKYEIYCIEQGLAGLNRLAPPSSPQATAIKRIDDEVKSLKTKTDPIPMLNNLPMFHKSFKDSLMKLEMLTESVRPKRKVIETEEETKKKEDTAIAAASDDIPTLPASAGKSKPAGVGAKKSGQPGAKIGPGASATNPGLPPAAAPTKPKSAPKK
jgi:hypothetical protein